MVANIGNGPAGGAEPVMVADPDIVSMVVPVYRDAERALRAAAALLALEAPDGKSLEVILVDDGSGDGTAERIAAGLPEGARLVRLERNCGRSGACNAGAARARGAWLVITDCDCLPGSEDLLLAHWRHFDPGVVATVGPVVGTGEGFWHEFQACSARRRAAQHRNGLGCAGSTANLMVRRDHFLAIGGFDEGFRAYGFEDRDLLARLGRLGRVAWAEDALIEHHDDLRLANVCKKMREAGAGGSGRYFAEIHPAEYRTLGYGAIDADLHPVRGWMARLLRPLYKPALAAVSPLLEQRWLPLQLRIAMARSLNGYSYLLGTAESAKRKSASGR